MKQKYYIYFYIGILPQVTLPHLRDHGKWPDIKGYSAGGADGN